MKKIPYKVISSFFLLDERATFKAEMMALCHIPAEMVKNMKSLEKLYVVHLRCKTVLTESIQVHMFEEKKGFRQFCAYFSGSHCLLHSFIFFDIVRNRYQTPESL